jgi:hypothetical protein
MRMVEFIFPWKIGSGDENLGQERWSEWQLRTRFACWGGVFVL